MKEYKFNINGTEYSVNINEVEDQDINLEVNGTPYKVTVDHAMRRPAPKAMPAATRPLQPSSPTPAASSVKPAAPKPAEAKGVKITTPLPGTILDVFVNVGDVVEPGKVVVNLEAMKMENNIESDVQGTVTAVNVRKGDSVLEGDTLVVIG
ncbi:MAG: biotin/lipoyl-containing protein [Bacteroidales bacterium]|nr:biotin/lipoyl-containing protein [Bacteroidales bacterium]